MARPIDRTRMSVVIACLLLAGVGLAAYASTDPAKSPARALETWVWQLRYRAFPLDDPAELAALHLAAEEIGRERCVACHGDKVDSRLLVHAIHLRSELLSQIHCHECHRQVDLTSRSATVAAVWVDVGFCHKCHSAFPGLQAGSQMHPGTFREDCRTCHSDSHEDERRLPFISRTVPVSECRGCHGGRVLPWTPEHARPGWLDAHGPAALETGTDQCFACHDFGLKFCDDCHAKKPPSHLPEDEWRAAHVAAAAADTRVCYSCHETTACKRCHVDHEEGWMASHPEFVSERGDSSCAECHSESACDFCHTRVASGSEGETASP